GVGHLLGPARRDHDELLALLHGRARPAHRDRLLRAVRAAHRPARRPHPGPGGRPRAPGCGEAPPTGAHGPAGPTTRAAAGPGVATVGPAFARRAACPRVGP